MRHHSIAAVRAGCVISRAGGVDKGGASSWLWLLAGWLGLVMALGAPPPVPLEREADWRIANFAPDSGVARRMVFDLAFATNHIIWFAVSDGLYRYDGYQWRRFTAADGLPSSFVRTVCVTRDGSVWVGTDNGAGVFDGSSFDRRGTEQMLAGPTVRRIVETSDGALWFCCDRWPDTSISGGLTRLYQGAFRTYGLADGLPSDQVFDLFEQTRTQPRRIALTDRGLAVQEGDRWIPMPDEGYPPDARAWSMKETPEGLLFAEGFDGTMVRQNGRWDIILPGRTPNEAPFCVTREGSVIKVQKIDPNRLQFSRWEQDRFVPASREVVSRGLNAEVVRQAPDGAIWAVGRGTILRWEYLPGLWEWRPELPPPVLEDSQHRLWFADKTRTVVLTGDQAVDVPGLHTPLAPDGAGGIWGAASPGVMRWANGQTEPYPPGTCGIRLLEGVAVDPAGTVWFWGRDPNDAHVVSRFARGTWQVFGPEALQKRRVASLVADPRQAGAWVGLFDELSSTFSIVVISADGMREVEIEGDRPQIRLPLLCASPTHLFVRGYKGLWESPLQEKLRFAKVQTEAAGVFTHGLSVKGTTAFVAQEGQDGTAHLLLRRGEGWLSYQIGYGDSLWLGTDGWLIAADGAGFVLWQTRDRHTPTYVNLPTDTTITSALRDTNGWYWVGTHLGVLRLRPGQTRPDTWLRGPDTLQEGAALVAEAKGLAPFTPQSLSKRHSFAWRIDGGPWSGYGNWPSRGIPLDGLARGRHLLEARARDGLGNEDPTPASLVFEILPIPIQDKLWFRLVLAGVGLAFAGLSTALGVAKHRLRRQADYLEAEVKTRTAELRQDIRRRELVEAERERLILAIEQAEEIIIITDARGTIQYVNPAFERVTGFTKTEAIGKTPRLLKSGHHPPAFYQELWTTLIRGEPWHGRIVNRKKDGTLYTEDATISPVRDTAGQTINYVAAKRDVTSEIRLQEQLLQAQKMESIGRLAGGVAHDFNNMLQSILGNAAMALEDMTASPQVTENLEDIQKAAQRSADLTRQLLTFARKQPFRPKLLDLNEAVSGMFKILRRLIREDLELVWLPGSHLWPVKLDPTHLDQILANLTVNAGDAIPGIGRITIETNNVVLDQDHNPPGSPPGDYVRISVSDNGVGMSREVQAHLFEPFFTTKGIGEGTGLGLATIYGIVKQNHGQITCYSELNKGTTFNVYLPRAHEMKTTPVTTEAEKSLQGSETILLVEDELSILKLATRLLERMGYRVLATHNPEEALRLASEHAGKIQLLISDVVMPSMNGRDLADRLIKQNPDLKCLFISGYTANVIAQHGVLEAGFHFVQKPFSTQDLAKKVREALDAPGVSPSGR